MQSPIEWCQRGASDAGGVDFQDSGDLGFWRWGFGDSQDSGGEIGHGGGQKFWGSECMS